MEDFISTLHIPKFTFLDPKIEDILIEDIAHSLSLLCRFGGHVPEFYSVAEHSILVSYILSRDGADNLTSLAGLLHDAEEAYLPDIPSPIKHHLRDAAGIYERLNNAVILRFGLEGADWERVKDVDSRIVITEAVRMGIWNIEWEPRGEPAQVELLFLDWMVAKRSFLQRFHLLRGKQ